MIELSPWAAEVLRRAAEAARRLNPDARIRLVARDGGIEPTLTDSIDPGDVALAANGSTIYADGGLAGLIDVEPPHDRLVLKPPGSSPNPRPDD